MKTKSIIRALSAMAALLLITACSDIDNTIIEQPDGKEYTTVPFTATVNNATGTRATLNTSNQYIFQTGDKLYVEGTGVYGYLTLKAGDEGKRTGATFEGNLNVSGTPTAELPLNAVLVSSTDALHTISGDKVTATTYPTTAIAATEAEAIEKYSDFTGSATYSNPSFTLNQQSAFISFDVTLVDNTAASTAVAVSISNDGGVVRTGSTTTANVSGDIKAQFVAAFPGGSTTLSDASVTLGTRPAISFGGSTALAVNKIYQVTKGYVDLSTLTANYEAKNGDMLTGALGGYYKISVADNATVTLNGVTINYGVGDDNDYSWAGITCNGDATIILADGSTNTVTGFYQDYPGIYVPTSKEVTIKGNGSLTASSKGYGAGIGAGGHDGPSCGNITIEGGYITATGGSSCAGIGSGYLTSCGNITISGGIIIATGDLNYWTPGIGCGQRGSCGTITITDGVTQVVSTKGQYAPNYIGIDHDASGSCGTVTIDGIADATTGKPFSHFTSTISTTVHENDTWTLTNNAPASSRALSSVTSSEVGWRIGSDGIAYSPVGTLPATVTPVAIIAYVGAAGSVETGNATYRGLAIALTDANNGNTCQWSNYSVTCTTNQTTEEATVITYKDGIASTTKLTGGCGGTHIHAAAGFADTNNGTSAPTTVTSDWFLPSIGQWQLIVQGLTGGTANLRINVENDTYKATSVNAKIIVAGGTGLKANDYWSCSEYNEGNAWFIRFSEGNINGYGKDRTTNMFVRSVLAF